MSAVAPNSDPITALSNEHVTLTQLFARHQEALVTRAWARAARLLVHYQKRLQHHIDLEERYLLPYYAGETAPGHWSSQVYAAEHRRLEELLNKVGTRLATARRRGVTATALIALLDQEKTLKHVLEHHHQREDVALFTALRKSLPEAPRSELMRALTASTGACAVVSINACGGEAFRYQELSPVRPPLQSAPRR